MRALHSTDDKHLLTTDSPALTQVDNAGRILHGHNGGVWEWTSTEFAGHPGFVPSELYPGYSADFFDGKHYTVVRHLVLFIPSTLPAENT